MRQEVRDALPPGMDEILEAEDIADAIRYMVTRPRHMGVNEMLIRPTDQDRSGRRAYGRPSTASARLA